MNGLRDQFFSGSGFTSNQDRGVEWCDSRDLFLQFEHDGTMTNHTVLGRLSRPCGCSINGF